MLRALVLLVAVGVSACGSTVEEPRGTSGDGGSSSASSTSSTTGTTSGPASSGASTGAASTSTAGTGGTGGQGGGENEGGAGGGLVGDPTTCAEADAQGSYLGCEFWPTVTPNLVWSIFDFAVTVTNPGEDAAAIVVERGGAGVARVTVDAGASAVVYLPWIQELKGADAACDGSLAGPPATSVRVPSGAYRLTSTSPVVVHQFSPIEAQGVGGPPGKDWSDCPGPACGTPCSSFTGDASLLLPTAALGEEYWVVGRPSSSGVASTMTLTGVADGTSVRVELGSLGGVVGTEDLQGEAGDTLELALDAGEVVTLVATFPGDPSGTRVTSDAPIQVITGSPCANVPEGAPACDHLEEVVLPIEAVGDRYVVARPSGPYGQAVGTVVRFVGHEDGTTLRYGASAPPGVPAILDAGEAVEVILEVPGSWIDVTASRPFSMITLLRGGSVKDDGVPTALGDPSLTTALPVSAWRTRYAIPPPQADVTAFVDVVGPPGTTLTLDGEVVEGAAEPLGDAAVVRRIPIAPSSRALVLEASAPVGAQVVAYAEYTSYAYPAGVQLP